MVKKVNVFPCVTHEIPWHENARGSEVKTSGLRIKPDIWWRSVMSFTFRLFYSQPRTGLDVVPKIKQSAPCRVQTWSLRSFIL